jgi:uncharacterized protein (DUF427 family)
MPDPAMAAGGITIADFPERVRTAICGIVIADSRGVKILREDGHKAVFYFPPEDVRLSEFLTPTATRTTCPKKGEASYWTFHLGDTQETDLAWAYPDPIPACAAIKDHIAFYWGRMDVWFVGDKPVSAPPA